jgi:tripartite-type tricarboxylate transporter receptor subunit TctC
VSHVESGEFRALAVTSRTRWAKLPDVPTVEEAALPGFEMTSWTGLAAPAETPPDIVARLNGEVRRAIKVPQVKSRLEGFGGDVRAMAPDEMRALVTDQLALWSRVAREANIRAE